MPRGACRDAVEEDVGGRQGETRPGNPDGMHLGCPAISAPKASWATGSPSGQFTQWNVVVSLVPPHFTADAHTCSASLLSAAGLGHADVPGHRGDSCVWNLEGQGRHFAVVGQLNKPTNPESMLQMKAFSLCRLPLVPMVKVKEQPGTQQSGPC